LVVAAHGFFVFLLARVVFGKLVHEVLIVLERGCQVMQFVLGLLAQRIIPDHTYKSCHVIDPYFCHLAS
jgi:hypothetical protein